ncbi:MAG: VCBS repeat-containing protein, partial [Promethearchaeota archaeon]
MRIYKNIDYKSPYPITCLILLLFTLFLSPILFNGFSKSPHTNPNKINTATVYSPWKREIIWSDLGANTRSVKAADFEGDGIPELVVDLSDNTLVIVNYSNGNYNYHKITIPEVSGKDHILSEPVDLDQDGEDEVYLYTVKDTATYWESEIW